MHIIIIGVYIGSLKIKITIIAKEIKIEFKILIDAKTTVVKAPVF